MVDNIRSNIFSLKFNLIGVLYIKKKLINILQVFLNKYFIFVFKVVIFGVKNNDN